VALKRTARNGSPAFAAGPDPARSTSPCPEKAYRLLQTARAENPATSYGDLVAAALVQAKPTLLADRPTPPDDPLLRPARTQRLHVEGRTRSRPFNVTPAQADAIRALADEVGIPNLSELVDRSVVLAYGRDAVPARR